MKKITIAFFLTLSFCLIVAAQETERKSSGGFGTGRSDSSEIKNDEKEFTTPLKITFKPEPSYTELARAEGIEGKVKIKVTFLANGEIGAVNPVAGLRSGLTEQALAAAKKIKFEPQTVKGVPVTVIKTVVFNFLIAANEDSEYIAQKAEITEMPKPEFPKDEKLKDVRGKVVISAFLQYDGEVSFGQISTDLPKEFSQSAIDAVLKIKFKPAIDKNGKNISISRVIEYEFKSQN